MSENQLQSKFRNLVNVLNKANHCELITDEELNDSIKILRPIVSFIRDLDRPKYHFFRNDIQRNLDMLEGFVEARKE